MNKLQCIPPGDNFYLTIIKILAIGDRVLSLPRAARLAKASPDLESRQGNRSQNRPDHPKSDDHLRLAPSLFLEVVV